MQWEEYRTNFCIMYVWWPPRRGGLWGPVGAFSVPLVEILFRRNNVGGSLLLVILHLLLWVCDSFRFVTKKNDIWTLRLDRSNVCSIFVVDPKSEVDCVRRWAAPLTVIFKRACELFQKNSKFLDLRPTTPKHEMFYHFKSHLSM